MILLAIPVAALLLGMLGARSSARTYLLIVAVAVVISYLAYTR